MDPRTLEQIAALVGGQLHGPGHGKVTRVVTDSRLIRAGEFFVALCGQQFDGHTFLPAVKEAAAVGALVSDLNVHLDGFTQIVVPDTLAALQRLARAYRTELPLKAIGVTGSSGKTSTKEMIASVLRERFAVAKTIGNYNNHIGLPLTVLGASSADDFGVFEMGMNHAGELAPLCEIAQPDASVIVNIGTAHLGHLYTRDAIAAEKAVVAEATASGGFVVLNADDDFTDWIAARCKARVVLAGLNRGQVKAQNIHESAKGATFTLIHQQESTQVVLPVHGEHMVANACMAAAVGLQFGLTLEECAAGLAKTAIPGNRLKIQNIGPLLVINDAYNANPDSMLAALKAATQLTVQGRRVAALGRMGELGKESEAAHRRVGRAVAEFEFDYLVTVGDEARLTADSASSAGLKSVDRTDTHEQAIEALLNYLEPGDLLLVKGSLSSAMDRVVHGLGAVFDQAKWRSP
ncbi:MAG: UDP-N-acetylmuramoyl-tripeptide--D-alanyl-D-alanine ligase [Verrucomicrobia bacterium]|nr:UDP-N-acetylmuramoyl-tripeptide--D-alanyl-D-alanine ligase [Verrucomicrobiota bacterium]